MDASKEIFLFTTVFHFTFSPLPEDNRGWLRRVVFSERDGELLPESFDRD